MSQSELTKKTKYFELKDEHSRIQSTDLWSSKARETAKTMAARLVQAIFLSSIFSFVFSEYRGIVSLDSVTFDKVMLIFHRDGMYKAFKMNLSYAHFDLTLQKKFEIGFKIFTGRPCLVLVQ